MSEEEINYEIDNCITDLDTLIILDKRAMKDVENNTHEIEQQEVLTIIREFIRLRNDYNKEKKRNKKYFKTLCNYEDTLEKLIDKYSELYNMSSIEEDTIYLRELITDLEKLFKKILNCECKNRNADLTSVYINGAYHGEKKCKDKIKDKIKEKITYYEELIKTNPKDEEILRHIIQALNEILEESEK